MIRPLFIRISSAAARSSNGGFPVSTFPAVPEYFERQGNYLNTIPVVRSSYEFGHSVGSCLKTEPRISHITDGH